MKYVVDASVGFKCVVAEAYSDKLVNNVQKQFPFVRHLSTLP